MTARDFIAKIFGSWSSWFELTKSCRYEASRQCAAPEVLMSLSRDAFRSLDNACARNLEHLAEAPLAQASEDEDAEGCSTLAMDNSAGESEDEASDDEPLLVQVSKAMFERMSNIEALAMEGRRKERKQINDALLKAAHDSSEAQMLDDLKQILLKPSADSEELMRLVATQNEENGRLLATLFQHSK
ncbi:hypothetical protein PF005_g15546 [Phytophthora fragariae]|uniref:Uncharacterized protein n=2 Tax=Phytophthora fragariae TaxID=53985 RepID=A0A6A3U3D6_9STRA|nr:hypothetical protein PF003_g4747 [Phytophthora fragariae]KAE9136939.1 hypothetical protein PF007_g2013 [Phytophthora fragariae]KAE9145845.1 hypothetical protein PF006_g9335 [Phytophthora fragariae]KAE9199918.1 hypothetical protein PF005_g15546 [Phytophthora fragariae]